MRLCNLSWILFIFFSVNVWGEAIEFSANSVSSVFTEGREQTVLRGDAQVQSGDFSLVANTITISGSDQRFIDLEGNVEVVIVSKDLQLYGTTVRYDRELERLQVQGQALLEDYANEVVVRGGYIEYSDASGVATIQINVKILKEDLSARAEVVRYLRDDERIELTGSPRVIYQGDNFEAYRIIIDTETNDISLEGSVSGTIGN